MAAAVSESTNVHTSFNPSWMRTTYHGSSSFYEGGGGPVQRSVSVGGGTEGEKYPLAPPVMAKNRYGREELLALIPQHRKAPENLEKCPFSTGQAQKPIVLLPLTEMEQRFQQNINSSKAMSSIAHAERERNSGVSTGPPIENRGERMIGTPFVPNWMERGGPMRGRGSFRGRGSHSQGPAGAVLDPLGRYITTRGRGSGRGGGSAGSGFNPRAQGLYDPKDPRDRPRQRLRSGGEESGTAPNNWEERRRTFNRPSNEGQGSLPEWMDDDENESDLREGENNEVSGGSFDDNGQFRPTIAPQENIEESKMPNNNAENAKAETNKVLTEKNSKNGRGDKTSIWDEDGGRKMEMKEVVISGETMESTDESCQGKKAILERGRSDSDDQTFAHVQRNAVSLVDSFAEDEPQPQRQRYRPQLMMQTPRLQAPDVTAPKTPSPPLFDPDRDQWQYRDPTGQTRGPFDSRQMNSWFVAGYFTMDLQVKRVSEPQFATLGDFIRRYGSVPFTLKSSSTPTVSSPANATLVRSVNPMVEVALKVQQERQRLQEEQQRVHEQEEQLKQAHESLMRQKEQRLRQAEMQRQQEEVIRQRRLEEEKAKERERLAEEQRALIEEEQRQAELHRRRQAQLQEEQRRREDEAKKIRLHKQQQEAALQKRQQNLLEMEQQRLRDIEQTRLAMERAQHEQQRLNQLSSADAPSQQKLNQAEQTVPSKSWQATFSPDGIIIQPKLTGIAWNKSVLAGTKGNAMADLPSLLAIQLEEKRQFEAEQKQQIHMEQQRRQHLQTNEDVGGAWGGSSQRLTWGQQQQHQPSQQQNVWTSAPESGQDKQLTSSAQSIVSTEKNSKKWSTGTAAASNQQQLYSGKSQHESVKKLFQQQSEKDPFQNWVVSKVNKLNTEVEADVFAAFIQGVDDPIEVEDYFVNYFGESKAVKELVKEYLVKRSKARANKASIEDDLSKPAAALTRDDNWTDVSGTTANGASVAPSAGNKKKRRARAAQKTVVDGSCLGFTATGDSNRVNVGDIEGV